MIFHSNESHLTVLAFVRTHLLLIFQVTVNDLSIYPELVLVVPLIYLELVPLPLSTYLDCHLLLKGNFYTLVLPMEFVYKTLVQVEVLGKNFDVPFYLQNHSLLNFQEKETALVESRHSLM